MKGPEILTLRVLNGMVKEQIKSSFPEVVRLVSEISEMSENRNGHCYLELIEKEEEGDAIVARAKAMIWSYSYRMLKPYFETSTGMKLEAGMKVLMTVAVEFHELYGYSLTVKDIDPSYSLGDLALKKQATVQRLRQEGVVDMNKELELFSVPQRLAIITSPTAAGYGDFMQQLLRNDRGLKFYTKLFPAVMQGSDTEASVIAALEKINRYAGFFDAVVLIRGGGAQAELHAFNSYLLALHLAQFPLPVLSGIGHERDETIADMVAWRSFKTPTAVAEFLVDTVEDFARLMDDYQKQVVVLASDGLRSRTMYLQSLAQSFVPGVMQFLNRRALLGQKYQARLQHACWLKMTQADKGTREQQMKFRNAWGQRIQGLKSRMESYGLKAQWLNPDHLLQRGFSLTMCQGKIITDVAQVQRGDVLNTRMRDGSITSVVEQVDNHIK